MTTEAKTQEELLKASLKNALDRDFWALYVKGFTTDWKIQRIARRLEIEVMPLDNLTEYILADRKAQAKRLLDTIEERLPIPEVADMNRSHRDGIIYASGRMHSILKEIRNEL